MYYSKKNQKIIFEVGDWVVEKASLSMGAFKLGEITGQTGKNSDRTVGRGACIVHLKNCRLANQDEIDAAMAKLAAAAETDDVKELILALCRKKGWI